MAVGEVNEVTSIFAKARGRQRIHQGDLVVGGHEGRFHLQAVAHAHFLHVDAAARAVPHRLRV